MMFHHSAISRAIAGGCALAFAAAACAAPASTASDAQPGATTTPGSVPSTDLATQQQQYIGPLDAFLGTGNGQQPTQEQLAQEQQQLRDEEQQIATCMQALGFQYVPADPNNDRRAQKDAMRAMPPGEFAAQYGYGISTIEFNDTVPDPNDTIVNAMTVSERTAYYHALYGDMVSIDGNGRPIKSKKDSPAPPPGQESCSEKADIAVFGAKPKDGAASSDAFTSLQDEMDALNNTIHSDPRMDAAMTAWSACMEAKGHPGYTTFTAGQDEVQARADQVIGDHKLSEVDPTALSELRAFEIKVATDEYQCSLPYEAVQEAVQTALEQAFIDQHRDELEQYRLALVASGKVGKG